MEKAGLLSRTRQFACHTSQLDGTGYYVAIEIGGESLFSIRDRDGKVRTFYNVCQHRAYQLASGESRARVVVCPYHAWTSELTCKLHGAPHATSVP